MTATSTPLRASPAPIPLTLPSLPYAAGNTTQRARSSTPRTSTTRAVNSRSRLRQSHTGLQDEDADAEGDDDPDADAEADPEEEEDLTLYCVCRKTSYGDVSTGFHLSFSLERCSIWFFDNCICAHVHP